MNGSMSVSRSSFFPEERYSSMNLLIFSSAVKILGLATRTPLSKNSMKDVVIFATVLGSLIVPEYVLSKKRCACFNIFLYKSIQQEEGFYNPGFCPGRR
jgi:hypothetical protein